MPSVSARYAPANNRFEYPSGADDPERNAPVVLMVSGGADSTALLVLACTSKLDIQDGRGCARIARERLHVLHVNHQLRGIDAEEDEEFVVGLAEQFGVPYTIRRVDVAALAAAEGGSSNTENVGREVRYRAAAEIANELSAAFGTPRSAARIVTAHTANDRAETFFMNAIRGTGPAGLSSIPRRRNRIVRPLLEYTHRELCDMLRMKGIVWREDATNEDTHYLRAFVRHEVMPVVEARNPRVTSSLSTTCDILSDEDAYLHAQAARSLRDLTRRQDEGMRALDAAKLAAADVVIARRVLRQAILLLCPEARLENRHIESVLRLIGQGSGSCTLPMGLDARVEYGMLFLRLKTDVDAISGLWLDVPGEVTMPDGMLIRARLIEVPVTDDVVALAREKGVSSAGNTIWLDAEASGVDDTLGGLLWIDAPAAGELLCPLGMHGQSKLLSDLLHDAGVPAADRSQVAVVHTKPRGQVIWVAGVRADERARVTKNTRTVLELTRF